MSTLGLKQFDKAMKDTNSWLADLMHRLDWDDRQRTYRLLRSTLHTLRDRLPQSEAVDLAAQLPTFLRGVYYEGWQLGKAATDEKTASQFAQRVEDELPGGEDIDPEFLVSAVFETISERTSEGEIAHVKSCLPPGIRALWQ